MSNDVSQARDGQPGRARRRSPLRRAGLGVVLVLGLVMLAALGAAVWIAQTSGGTRWAVEQAARRVAGLEVETVSGTLASGLRVEGLRYAPEEGPRVSVRSAYVELALGDLLQRTLHVERLAAEGVHVLLRPGPDPQQDDQPTSLDPPIDVLVDSAAVTDAVISDETGSVADVRRATASGRWTTAGLELDALDVLAEQGAVHLEGRLSGGPDVYDAQARGRFRWRTGGREYAGTVEVATQEQRLQADVRLTAPFEASLEGGVRQTDELPWQAELRVPPFDPGRRLLPDTGISLLAATVAGSGTATTATLRGEVTLDDLTMHLQRVRLAFPEAGPIVLESLVARIGEDQGELRANGRLLTEGEVPSGALEASWSGVELPESLVGQPLHTRGELRASGSADAYDARATLAIGPPGRLADVRIRAQGTPERVKLEQLDVVQDQGRLAATGTLELEPRRGWQLQAEAESFDPGELLANWPGELDLALETEGTLTNEGPRGSLQLEELRGTLRGRPIRGSGAVDFAPPLSLAGRLRLQSGASRLRIDAAPGSALDATAVFEIAALADFLPQARGTLEGRIRARGQWPEVQVEARASGSGLHLAGASVASLSLEANLRDPVAPSGTVQVNADGLSAGGFEFGTASAEAGGTPDEYRLTFDAEGERLAVAARVTGSPTGDKAWTGSIERLRLQLPAIADLQLKSPARFQYATGSFGLSRICLADGTTSLCAAADVEPDGSLQASYALAEVPLSLASAVLPDAMPGRLAGTLEGEGTVRRTGAGLWRGTAALESSEARIEWQSEAVEALAGSSVLIYENLRLDASLRGPVVEANLVAALGGDGRLEGEVAVTGLDAGTPRIRGRIDANLPTLAPLAPFVPQLAGLDGRVDASIGISGTVAEPAFSGAARASELSADVPLLGIEITDGRLVAETRADGALGVSGSVSSGDTRLEMDGSVSRSGGFEATIQGRQFLAADLPGMRVLVTPDLLLERDADRLSLTGTVRIPSASVNLQRLPQMQPAARAASPDVVVVNEPPPEVDAADEALPLYAEITVILGDEIEVTGFGLEATVDGQVVVREAPGRDATGSGEVRIDGTYRAYGQDLSINQGQILYAGTPIDNPRLFVEAVRDLGDLTAGLRITGTAQSPQVNVFSSPTVGETDALAYLVTGRPLNSIGTAGAEETGMLQEASQSIGAAAGGLLAQSLGRRIGIDEVGVAESEVIGGAALTLGQYLSPRLYVGFGVGLFDPGQVVTIRYEIADDFTVEAATGEETTRAGIYYRVER